MTKKEKVLENIQKLEREDFEKLCLICLEKLGIKISNFKAMSDHLVAEGTVKMENMNKDYIIKFSRSINENSLEDLKRFLTPSTEGLFLSPEEVQDHLPSEERVEIVGPDKLFQLLNKFDLISKFDLDDQKLKADSKAEKLIQKGKRYLTKGRCEKAIDALEAALEMDPKSTEAWQLIGKSYRFAGQKEEALKAYEKISDLEGKNTDILKEKGRLLYELRRYDEAILCFEQIVDLGYGTKEVWNNKALCHMRNGEYEESLHSIEKALSLDPEFEDALLNKALIYEDMGNIEKALNSIEILITKYPYESEYHFARAAYLRELSRVSEAREALEEALRLEPDLQKAAKLKTELDEKT